MRKLIAVLFVMLFCGVCNAAITQFTDEGLYYKQYDFEDETIATSSSKVVKFIDIGGAAKWRVFNITQSTGTVTTFNVQYIDSKGNVITSETGNVDQAYTIEDLDSGVMQITLDSNQGAPVTMSGSIKFDYSTIGGSSGTQNVLNPSYDETTDSDQVTVLNDWEAQRLAPVILLNAVTATGDGTAQDVVNFRNATLYIYITGTATVDIEQSHDNVDANYIPSPSLTGITATTIKSISSESLNYIRPTVSSYSSGSVTVVITAGN